MPKKSSGWKKEPARHALASKGVRTRRLKYPAYIVGHPDHQPAHVERETADILKIEHELGHWDEDPAEGTIFRDIHTGHRLVFLEVDRHPVTREIVNVLFKDEGDHVVDYRDFSEVYPAED